MKSRLLDVESQTGSLIESGGAMKYKFPQCCNTPYKLKRKKNSLTLKSMYLIINQKSILQSNIEESMMKFKLLLINRIKLWNYFLSVSCSTNYFTSLFCKTIITLISHYKSSKENTHVSTMPSENFSYFYHVKKIKLSFSF